MTQGAVVTPWTFYVGDAVLTSFAFPWYLQASAELEVYLAGSLTTAYTLSGLQSPTGGTITFFVPPPSGQILFLRRVTPQTQLTDYISNDPFDAQAHEAALDKLTREVQDVSEQLSRRPALLLTSANAVRNLLFPAPEALGLLGWNADASGLTLYSPAIVQVTIDPVSGEARGKSSATLTASPGSGAPLAAVALAPAGARCMAVTLRNVVAWNTSNGLSGMDLGGFGQQDGWGQDLPLTLPFASNPGYFRRGDEPIAVNGEDITLTPKGGTWGGAGSATVTVHWKTYSPD